MTNNLRILSNLGNAFFTASGMWGDLLLIRIFLTCAYAFIIAFQFTRDHNEYENYVWAFACIYLHGSSAIRLIIDEGPVMLNEKQEQVRHHIPLLLYRSFQLSIPILTHIIVFLLILILI